jgi:hypothetical protein
VPRRTDEPHAVRLIGLSGAAPLVSRVGRNLDAQLARFGVAPRVAGFTSARTFVVVLSAAIGSPIDHTKDQVDLREPADLCNHLLGVLAQAKGVDIASPTDPPSPLGAEPKRLG